MGNGREGIFVVWLFTGLIFWSFFTNTVNNAIGEMLAVTPATNRPSMEP